MMEYAALTNRYVTHRHAVAINCCQFQPPRRQSRLDFLSPFINGLLSDGSQRSLFLSASTTVGTLAVTPACWRFGRVGEGPPAEEQDSSFEFIIIKPHTTHTTSPCTVKIATSIPPMFILGRWSRRSCMHNVRWRAQISTLPHCGAIKRFPVNQYLATLPKLN